jgi:glycosyltransferase involved in cell wall biosynthesis
VENRALRKQPQIMHLSSVHPADDIRIFWKECVSLAQAGYDVTLTVARKPNDPFPSSTEGVRILSVKRRDDRFGRMAVSSAAVILAGWRQHADLYHFHDSELIPGALLLRLLGRRVIYDVHEDLPRVLLIKHWLPRHLRMPLARAAAAIEWLVGHAMSGVVVTTPVIARRFPKRRTALVRNFPRLGEFATNEGMPYRERQAIAYVGSVGRERCAIEMVEAIARVKWFPEVRLIIGGPISPASLVVTLADLPGWSRVDFRDRQDRAGILCLLGEARLGLAIYHPVRSYIDCQPTKLFEYMAAGIPVVASDFPGFREVVETYQCGLCVPPCDVSAIASAIEWLLEHPAEAEDMGRRGRDVIMSRLNWEREADALVGLYDSILGVPRPSRDDRHAASIGIT